ncbi:MAG: hypothetical protein M3Z80_08125 [Apibacter sp.]|uniref:hypothetical protein n=1 Tax=Apibacter sp. TaxID=2023709 RepID=UPI0025D65285|nr:hypothetical protein [Apibacter sp.]MCT6869897.1 hypothetical protein [Apibacter sp.]
MNLLLAVRGLSPDEIQAKYSLPEIPTHITKVTVPTGTRMRSGRVNPIFGGADVNAKQFQLLERIPIENYGESKLIKCP